MPHPLWTPDPERCAQTTLTAFSSWLSARAGRPLGDFDALHRFSTGDSVEFWSALWDFAQVSGDKGEPPYLANGDRMPGASFFPGARLNFAENLLRHEGRGDAIVFWGEDKVRRRLTWDVLTANVGRASRAFAAAGVVAGDRVAGMLPNMPEGITSMLGAATIGAVWSSCSPISACRGCSTGSARSSPRCSSPATATTTTARASTSPTSSPNRSTAALGQRGDRGALPRAGEDGGAGPQHGPHPRRAARDDLGQCRALAAARPADVREVAVLAPALRPVLVRDHGQAQVHRAQRRRPAAAAQEGTGAALRPQGGRAAVLLHHLRLDDVELAHHRASPPAAPPSPTTAIRPTPAPRGCRT